MTLNDLYGLLSEEPLLFADAAADVDEEDDVPVAAGDLALGSVEAVATAAAGSLRSSRSVAELEAALLLLALL